MKPSLLLKRILRTSLVIGGLLIALFIAIPFLFRDQLIAMVQTQINASVTGATVEFSDVRLSLFKSFPDFHFTLTGLSVKGRGEFEGIPLVSASEIGLTLDLFSVLQSEKAVVISGVQLIDPTINILITAAGKANYDITTEQEQPQNKKEIPESEPEWEIDLEHYSIENARFVYNDKMGGMLIDLNTLNHTGRAKLKQDVYDLTTNTSIGQLTVEYGGIKWLSGSKVELDAGLEANMNTMTFTLRDNRLQLNALNLEADGRMKVIDDSWERIELDLELAAPNNDFKDILSLVPGAFIQGYENVDASGQFDLSAKLSGEYNGQTGALPSYGIDLKVRNGAFQYPGLPLGVNTITVDAQVTSPDADPDHLITVVETFSLTIDDQPFTSAFSLKTPISDPYLQASAVGTLDLSKLSKAFPVEGIEKMSGIVMADFKADAHMSDFDRKDFDRIVFDGSISASDMHYHQTGFPPVLVKSASVNFSPKFIDIPEFNAQLGKSSIQAAARIDNILAWLTPDQTMTGRMKLRSPLFDANEWMVLSEEESVSATSLPEEDGSVEIPSDDELFNRFEFACDLQVDEIVYDNYDIKNAQIQGSISPSLLQLDKGYVEVEGSDFSASGNLVNWWGFLFDGTPLNGTLDIASRTIDLNPFMAEEEPENPEPESALEDPELSPIILPQNVDLQISARTDRFIYTDMVLKDLSGIMTVSNSEARITDAKARALGGTIALEGGYNTSDPDQPRFDFKYDLSSLDFRQTFTTINTFQALAPIGQAISGTFNSGLAMSGVLGKDFMPDLSRLDMAGYIQTLNGIIQNFGPLNTISEKLQLDISKALPIQDTKNWFEVSDGKMTVEPFDWKVEDILMTVNGWHSIAGEGMDYSIKASVPRERIRSTAPGELAISGLDWATSQAGKLGIDLGKAETLNFEIGVTGTLRSPQVKVKLLGAGSGEGSVGEALQEQAGQALKSAVDEAREKAEKEVAALKSRAEAEADSIKQMARQKIDTAAQQLKKEAAAQVDSLKIKAAEELKKQLEEKTKKGLDSLLDKKKESVEEKLKKWNPLKKKDGE